ncbi:zinc finger protein 511 [Panulirus ornatus]|uniref:zinc finger protein 511 n=1 Tax=Panulirus ornatus TaxID=150431 RepID=UPI003A85266D
MWTSDSWSYLVSLGVQHRSWDDPLFVEGLNVCHPLRKVPCVDIDEEDFLHDRIEAITCNVVGCNKSFTTVAEHAGHQRTCHSHICGTCKHTFASNHLLDLHLLEVHDTLFQLMAERKPMYQCLLETCPEKFSYPAERKTHCIEKHSFPADYRFNLAWRKLGKSRKGRGKGQKEEELSAMECEVMVPVDVNPTSMVLPDCVPADDKDYANTDTSSRKRITHKIPNSVSFGAGVPRGFNRRIRGRRGCNRGDTIHWHQRMRPSNSARTSIEEVSMKDLEEALVKESTVL